MEQVVNFLDKLEPEKRLPASLVAMLGAWGLIVLSYSAYSVFLYMDEGSLKQEHQQIMASNRQLQAQLDQKNAADKALDLNGPRQQMERLLRQKRQRQLLIANLQDPNLNNVRGFSAYLTGIARQHRSGVSVESIRLNQHGSTFYMAGKVREPGQLPAYIVRLGEEYPFADMAFESVKIASEDNLLEFEVQSFAEL